MMQAQQNRRLFLTGLLLVIAFCGLGYRLVDLQVYRHDELLAAAKGNSSRTELLIPRRGDIYDARGNLLSTSLPAKTIFADPVFIGQYQANIAKAIAPLIGLSEWDLYHKLQPKVYTRTNDQGQMKVVTNRYVVLARKVPLDRWREIRERMGNLEFGDESKLTKKQRSFFRNLRRMAINADIVEDTIRVYPNRELAAHVLGYVSSRDITVNDRQAKEVVGMDGIERAFNNRLTGTPGWRETETDRRRREVATKRLKEISPTDGLNIHLTLDARLQHVVEQRLAEVMDEFKPESATAILVRPQTGQILAMANVPTFDPNRPGEIPEGREDYRRNRAIMDAYPPGSTFKMVSIAAGLQHKVVGVNEVIYCEKGAWKFGRAKVLREYRGKGFEDMTISKILAKSSNIGTSKIAVRMPPIRFEGYLREFGFGSKTDIDLVGESRGMLRSSKGWGPDDRTRIPIGQGVTCTPLQMTMAVAALANGGYMMRPLIIDRLEDHEGNVMAKYSPTVVRQVVNQRTAKQITEALKTVVSPVGTAKSAIMEYYSVAGKTGTSDIPLGRIHVNGRNLASFIGYLPASNPELVIAVFVNLPKGGGTGGRCAAPAFKQIALTAANYLNLKPDLLGVSAQVTQNVQTTLLRTASLTRR